jgi:hypothetical protein
VRFWGGTIQYNTQYSTGQRPFFVVSSVLYLFLCGMVWDGLGRCGMVWGGIGRYGMVRHDVGWVAWG